MLRISLSVDDGHGTQAEVSLTADRGGLDPARVVRLTQAYMVDQFSAVEPRTGDDPVADRLERSDPVAGVLAADAPNTSGALLDRVAMLSAQAVQIEERLAGTDADLRSLQSSMSANQQGLGDLAQRVGFLEEGSTSGD